MYCSSTHPNLPFPCQLSPGPLALSASWPQPQPQTVTSDNLPRPETLVIHPHSTQILNLCTYQVIIETMLRPRDSGEKGLQSWEGAEG